mmetsp:Transcript_18145/g.50494  ORF Transcript_18145/g.50494 Transcript_18145/m.50494 type:complete len:289 (+) Transcript_18145:165-1031(+)
MPGGHEGGDSEPVETGTGTNAAASGTLSVRSQSAGGPLVPETVLGLAPGPDSSDRSPVAPRLPQPARANGRDRQGGRLLSNPIDRVRGIQADRKIPGPDRGRSAQRDGAENAPPPKTVDQGRPPLRAHAQGIRNSRRNLEALPPRPGRPLPLQQPPRGRPHHLSGGRPPGGRRGQQVPKGPPRNVQQAGHAENTLLCQHAQDRGLLLTGPYHYDGWSCMKQLKEPADPPLVIEKKGRYRLSTTGDVSGLKLARAIHAHLVPRKRDLQVNRTGLSIRSRPMEEAVDYYY